MASAILSRFSLRHLALVALCLIYGLFGSPTPQDAGWAEMAAGICLFVAIGPKRILLPFIEKPALAWMLAAQFLLFYGMSVPLLFGLMAGYDPGMMLRDVIPFFFLLLPFFMASWQDESVLVKKTATAAIVFIGVAFGARSFMNGAGHDSLYLSIAPTVVFAAIFLAAMAGLTVFRAISPRSIMSAAVLIGLAFFPFAAMIVTLQRASLGLSAVALGCLFLLALWRNPLRAAAPALLIFLVLFLLGPNLGIAYESLMLKQGLVGNNMRLQEAAAVFDALGNIWQVVLGKGWGATLASPAVGGVTVNYTHNLFTTYWLKTGLAGVVLLALYLFGLVLQLFRLFGKKPLLAMALAVPVAIDAVLYASFKSLDFGLVLLLVALWAEPWPRLRGDPA
jgi:hypothetical protein